MNDLVTQPKILVLCTLTTGIDSLAEVLRRGFAVEAVIGLDPKKVDPAKISGFTDIEKFAEKWNIPFYYAHRYDLNSDGDRNILESLDFDLVWVKGWQRLIPSWLINLAPLGALGGHGSPDGIHGGRGRSPQNWALILGCRRFDLALFRITPGIDDGPVVAQRSFFYNDTDDIAISYKKASLCMAEMMIKVLQNPSLIDNASNQKNEAFYYPQRKPEDGYVDWSLSQVEISRMCRALTKPYPGMRAKVKGIEIVIWDCVSFDDQIGGDLGVVDFVFEDGQFLVNCKDGRLLIRCYDAPMLTELLAGDMFEFFSVSDSLQTIFTRHYKKLPNTQLASRILRMDPRGK